MKKVLLSGFVIFTFIGYALQQKFDTEKTAVVAPYIPTATPTPTPPLVSGGATSTPTSRPLAGAFRDGAFTGSVADAYYGNVQVKTVITGGKISDVQFLQYPNDRRTSIEINQQAMPYLKEEAIQAQSARVDGISGATQTSHAFIESLQSALNQAK